MSQITRWWIVATAPLVGLVGQTPPAATDLDQLAPPGATVAAWLADTDGDGRLELLHVGTDGVVSRYAIAAAGRWQRRGGLQLADPAHTLLTTADIDATPGAELVVCDPSGTGWLGWPADDRIVATSPTPLVRRARNTLRVDRPQRSPFVQDLNRDGRLDILLPTLQGVQPFLQEAPAADGALAFRSMQRLPVSVQTTVADRSGGRDQELQGSVVIPQITTADLDGDGRPDLLTRTGDRHAFHLQGDDGVFQPPLEVDLTQFEDTTPKATIAPGSTVVLGDRQLLQRGDVDGDRIPDYVIAHRRKVWTFLASPAGPQFQRARTQAVADDVTGMLLLDLDDDQKADLLAFQVQLPSIGSLLLGLVQSIDIDIKAVGYRAEGGAFAGTPAWRRVVTLRIPPILSLLGKQQELVQRFTDILGKARLGARGGLFGAGRPDLALLRADGTQLDLFAMDQAAPTLDSKQGRALLRRLLFEDPNPVFDIDRVFALVSGLLDEFTGGLIGDKQPVASLPLRDTKEWRVAELLVGPCRELDRDDLIVVYERVPTATTPAASTPERVFVVVGVPDLAK
jgi:hypothetical protein